jgi:hypothetical protein
MAGDFAVDLCSGKRQLADEAETTAACVLQQGLSDSGVTRSGIGFPAGQLGGEGYAVACSFNAHWKYSWRTFKGWVLATHTGRWFFILFD